MTLVTCERATLLPTAYAITNFVFEKAQVVATGLLDTVKHSATYAKDSVSRVYTYLVAPKKFTLEIDLAVERIRKINRVISSEFSFMMPEANDTPSLINQLCCRVLLEYICDTTLSKTRAKECYRSIITHIHPDKHKYADAEVLFKQFKAISEVADYENLNGNDGVMLWLLQTFLTHFIYKSIQHNVEISPA